MLLQRNAVLTLLASSALAYVVDLSPDSLSETTISRSFAKRQSLGRIVVVGGNIGKASEHYCSQSEVSKIDYDISWMRKLAASAFNFLLKDKSETTAAYIAWFGANNANRETANSIRRNVYNSIWDLGDETKAYVSDLDSGSDAVVIGCPSLREEPGCDGTMALAGNEGGYVKLCPLYFQSPSDYEELFRSWRMWRTRRLTGGETLLHEMTHLAGVVGSSWRATDVAYEEDKCLLLDDSDMIRNADNFMFFALEVKANPDNAAKQVDMDADEPKYKIARRLLADGSGSGGAGSSQVAPGMWVGNHFVYGQPGVYGYPQWPPPWC
ncbi:24 kDa metalloproteinase [Colletotrichum higginsianum IMI 349063]|uniref:24 kDa metalloproteinase n=2 Tax=Colletotrichum higginsianum TaxID=80884 RepID=A0A1B7XR32_COLHI|nr:24 kDa metalloproteinase [Colletotrichum higginsianum IMI 349063]OBR02216.1 24 kDa metalloproteinase [Colletotrichum higginsianum IMI 349063]